MAEYGPCEICGNQAEYNTLPPNWPLRRTCPRCGEFEYDELSRPAWPKPSPDGRARLSLGTRAECSGRGTRSSYAGKSGPCNADAVTELA